MTELDQLRRETVRFMRGQYRLDELADNFYQNPCVKFRQGKKTILTVILHEDFLEFLIIFGKAERERFDAARDTFPAWICRVYDEARALHDGKWMFFRADKPEDFEPLKRLIQIKKKPNRKPFPKKNVRCARCGHRCDLCVHYIGLDEDFCAMLIPHLNAVYGPSDWAMRCTGCGTAGCQPECAGEAVGYQQLEARNLSADDVTWGILPYVDGQYES